MRQHSRN